MKHPHSREDLRILSTMRALFFIHAVPMANHLDQRKMSSSFGCSCPIESVRILSPSVPVLLQWLPHPPPGMLDAQQIEYPSCGPHNTLAIRFTYCLYRSIPFFSSINFPSKISCNTCLHGIRCNLLTSDASITRKVVW